MTKTIPDALEVFDMRTDLVVGDQIGASVQVTAGLRVYGVSDLLDLPEPNWLIHDTLPEQSLDVLYGPPGSAKSFVAIDKAAHTPPAVRARHPRQRPSHEWTSAPTSREAKKAPS